MFRDRVSFWSLLVLVMNTIILGGGFSGLAAGIATDGTVYEASEHPGGLGHEYEVDGYRFSVGGGHWCFGGDPLVTAFIKSLCDIKRYKRKSSVYFPDKDVFIPYPIQAHLKEFSKLELAAELAEMDMNDPGNHERVKGNTMRDDLLRQFGDTLCELFFFPFNELYTAGLYDKVAPQDRYKSPVKGQGYNETFIYPTEGLGVLARRMAARCNIRFGKRAKWIDVNEKMVHFEDDTCQGYDRLISTLPLSRMMEMALPVLRPDPHVSVLVLNIGAVRGPKCPDDHWVYVPRSKSGFHRVGFYSNVDSGFAPEGKVGVYVERAFVGGERPRPDGTRYATDVLKELDDWGWIKGRGGLVDLTWVDVAYTYRWPGSTWREDSLKLLKKHDIHSIGRYGNWKFCGIVQSMREGFEACSQLG